MADAKASGNLQKGIVRIILDNSVPVAIVVGVLMIFIPLPKVLIDIFMVINLALAIIILLTVLYTRKPSSFASFPQLVLFTTIFGLAINISSTRLMLTNPVTGSGSMLNMSGQSELVKSFGSIVTGGSVVVGFLIFIIITIVQVVVISKGATRVSEVSARFTLDGMNSRMFDIQNEVNAGNITEEEAKKQKADLRQEIAFFSTMDGASKFVSGNVKAGIFITVINIVGGIITGMIGGLDISSAFKAYAQLTVGDGLMSQLPSLLLSFSTGMLVTGGSSEDFISDKLKHDFSINGTIYIIVGATLLVLGLGFHNMSSLILLPIGVLFILLGVRMQNMDKKKKDLQAQKEALEKSQNQKGSSPDDVSPAVSLDVLSLDLGYALIPLVDKEKGAELLERVTRIRRECALDLGLVVPPIRIRDNMSLDPDEYSFKIRGIEAGSSKLKLGYYMCLNPGTVDKANEIKGEPAIEPTFGMQAIWIPEDKRVEAERANYAVVDPPTIVATHLTELIRRNAASILGRQEVSAMIEKLKEKKPVVVNEVLQGDAHFTYGQIEQILKNLLEERVSIRNLETILETLADYGTVTKDIWILTQKVRDALGKQICLQYCDEKKTLRLITLSQQLSQTILEHGQNQMGGHPILAMTPSDYDNFIEKVTGMIASLKEKSIMPVILCPGDVRAIVRYAITDRCPGVSVIATSELLAAGREIKAEVIGEIN